MSEELRQIINDIIEDRIDIFDETTTTNLLNAPNNQSSSSSIQNIESQNEINNISSTAECGIELIQDVFEGAKIRYITDNEGKRWIVGYDMWKALGLNSSVAAHIIERIRTKDPLSIRLIPATVPGFKGLERCGKPRIILNKHGISHFLIELNVSRIQDPNVRMKCERFRTWVARLIGDIMTGDVTISTQKPEQNIIEMKNNIDYGIKPVNPYAIISHAQSEFAIGLQVGALCPKIPGKQIITVCLKNIMQKTGFNTERYISLVERHYDNDTSLFETSRDYIDVQNTIKSFTKALIEKIEDVDAHVKNIPKLEQRLLKIEKENHNTPNIKHVILSLEQNGYPEKEVKAIVKDAENIAANEISV